MGGTEHRQRAKQGKQPRVWPLRANPSTKGAKLPTASHAKLRWTQSIRDKSKPDLPQCPFPLHFHRENDETDIQHQCGRRLYTAHPQALHPKSQWEKLGARWLHAPHGIARAPKKALNLT